MRSSMFCLVSCVALLAGLDSLSAQSPAGRAGSAARSEVLGAADTVGRSRPAGHLHERRRERHADGAAGRSRGQAARGLRRQGDGGAARRTTEARAGRRAQHRRKRGRGYGRGAVALVRASGREQRAAVARLRSAKREDPADDRCGQAARGDPSGGTQGTGARRLVDGPEPLRSLHLARSAWLDDADDLRQRLRHHAEPGLRRDPLRDDSRGARHPGGQQRRIFRRR